MVTRLTSDNLSDFFSRNPESVILFDADWSEYKDLSAEFRKNSEAYPTISFGEVDVNDPTMWDKLNEWSVANVPVVGCFRDGKLLGLLRGNGRAETFSSDLSSIFVCKRFTSLPANLISTNSG